MADKLLRTNDSITVPGWYRDPTGDSDQRFWDGAHWTLLTRDDVAADDLIIENGGGSNVDRGEIVLFGGPPAGHPDALSTRRDRREADARQSKAQPLFETTSPERRVVTFEPAAAQLPKRRRREAAPSRSLFSNEDGSAEVDSPTKDASPQTSSDKPISPTAVPAVVKPTRIASPTTGQSQPQRQARPKNASRSRTATTDGRRRLLLLALALGAGGLTIGYLSGSSSSDQVALEANKSLTESVNSAAAASGRPGQVIVLERELQRAGQDLKTTNDELVGASDEILELEEVLVDTEAELEVVTAERDDLQDHNDVLQTWFTDDLRLNGQIAWDTEVARACDLVNKGAILSTDLLQYTRSMEIIGTETGLYRAVAACAAN